DLFFPLDKKSCRAELRLPTDCQLIGTAGALDDNRGIQSLYGAFDIIKDRYPDLHLVLAGPRKGNLPRTERIRDLGVLPLEKVPLVLNALDVAVICNRNSEFGKYCFPQKAAEIMACDVPLIAARVGSMAGLFKKHPEWLFTPESKRDLATALEYRLAHRTTDYTNVTSWQKAAKILEKLMFQLNEEHV
ncbi:MAG: glycosyltransferase, partial [bacterium]|nr:glycosyltransferase [bacterium]